MSKSSPDWLLAAHAPYLGSSGQGYNLFVEYEPTSRHRSALALRGCALAEKFLDRADIKALRRSVCDVTAESTPFVVAAG